MGGVNKTGVVVGTLSRRDLVQLIEGCSDGDLRKRLAWLLIFLIEEKAEENARGLIISVPLPKEN